MERRPCPACSWNEWAELLPTLQICVSCATVMRGDLVMTSPNHALEGTLPPATARPRGCDTRKHTVRAALGRRSSMVRVARRARRP